MNKGHWVLDHIAYACEDFEDQINLYKNLMGYELQGEEIVESEGLKVAFLKPKDASQSLIELICPLPQDETMPPASNKLAQFIDKRGAGLHHVCFRVTCLESSIKEAEEHGLIILPGYPKTGSRGKKIAFFSPKQTGGVLTEICSAM